MSSAKTAFNRATFQKAQSQSHSNPRTEQGKKKSEWWFGIGLICNKKKSHKIQSIAADKAQDADTHASPIQSNPIQSSPELTKRGGTNLVAVRCCVRSQTNMHHVFSYKTMVFILYFPQICDAQIPDWLDSFGIYFNWQTQPTYGSSLPIYLVWDGRWDLLFHIRTSVSFLPSVLMLFRYCLCFFLSETSLSIKWRINNAIVTTKK